MKTNQTNHIQITVIPTSLGYAIKTRERGTDDFLINLVNPQSELLEKAVAFIEECIRKQSNKNSFFENIYMQSLQRFPNTKETLQQKQHLIFHEEKLNKLHEIKGEVLGVLYSLYNKEEDINTLMFRKGEHYIASDLRIIDDNIFNRLLFAGYEFIPLNQAQEDELYNILQDREIEIYEY